RFSRDWSSDVCSSDLMAIGLDHFHPGLVTFLRVGFGAATLALVPRARHTPIAREDWPRVVVLGVIWIALPLTFFPIAQQWINSRSEERRVGKQCSSKS